MAWSGDTQPDAFEETSASTNKTQLAELERIHQKQRCPPPHRRRRHRGSTRARIDVRGELKCGRDVEIDINCVFEGTVVELG